MDNTQQATREIRVWDLPLRLFHWALVVCVTGSILSAKLADDVSDLMDWHRRFGFTVLALLLFRLIWGFVGGTHARFANFVRGPGAILDYLKQASRGTYASIGHNPLGALSVLALIVTMLFQAISGLFITDELTVEGPLYKHVSNSVASALAGLHEGNGNLIIGLVLLHLAAILFYRFVKRDNLVSPMFTGKKNVPAGHPAQDANGGGSLAGVVLMGVIGVAVWYFVTHV